MRFGGHYDSVVTSPGANDNGTGAAATLELAKLFAGKKPSLTLRFVEFVNEEPPFFRTEHMGSLVYAKRCRERKEKIVAILSLETMGYYSDEIQYFSVSSVHVNADPPNRVKKGAFFPPFPRGGAGGSKC